MTLCCKQWHTHPDDRCTQPCIRAQNGTVKDSETNFLNISTLTGGSTSLTPEGICVLSIVFTDGWVVCVFLCPDLFHVQQTQPVPLTCTSLFPLFIPSLPTNLPSRGSYSSDSSGKQLPSPISTKSLSTSHYATPTPPFN